MVSPGIPILSGHWPRAAGARAAPVLFGLSIGLGMFSGVLYHVPGGS